MKKFGDWIEGILLLAVLLSTLGIVLESDKVFMASYGAEVMHVMTVLNVVFVVEYLARLVLTQKEGASWPSMKAYAFSFFGLVDFLSILPVIFAGIPGLAAAKTLRLLRIFRILKVARYSDSLQLLGSVISKVKMALFSTLFMTLLVVLISSVVMYYFEHEAQPEAFPSIAAACWWGIATLTTVGYGDIYPITAMGKVFSSIIALLGIGLVAIPTGIISGAYVQALEDQKNSPER